MRAYRLMVSPRATVWSLAVSAALVLAFGMTPFAGFYLFFLVVMVFPFIVQITLTTAGLLPAVGTALIVCGALWRATSLGPALFALSYLLPLVLLMAGCLYVKLPYQKTMLVLVLGYASLVLVLFMAARQQLGDDPFLRLSTMAVDAVRDMPDRDMILNTFYRYGLLSLPAELAADPLVEAAQGYTFAPQVLAEFYKQISTRVDLWLRSLLPTLLTSHSINWGVLGLFISLFYGNRQAHREAYRATDDRKAADLMPHLGQPHFSQWYIPKQLGRLLFVFIGLWLVIRLSGGDAALSLGGQMMYNVSTALFGIQGLGFVNFMQKKRDTRPRTRGAILVLLYLLLPFGLLLLGIYDQVTNPRKLPREGSKDETPRGGMNP